MPNAGAPAGPAKPINRKREQIEQREQIDEALRPDPDAPLHGGHAVTRNQPSPQARDENTSGRRDEGPAPDQIGRQR